MVWQASEKYIKCKQNLHSRLQALAKLFYLHVRELHVHIYSTSTVLYDIWIW